MTASPEIRLKSRLLPILVGLLLILQLVSPSQVWTVLLTGLGGAWLVSYLWVRVLANNLSLRREMRYGWAQVGDRLEERFTLLNRSWIPALWVEVRDHSNLPGYCASRVTGVGEDSKQIWRTEGSCNQRGAFTLGPTSLHTGDPFGIYSLSILDPASTSLMVMPPVVPLPTIEIAPGGRTGEGRPRANALDRTVSASSVREYISGDSLHQIHWRTTARRDELFVRIFDGTPAGDCWIVLDLDSNVQAGQGWDSTQEHGIILAASLADRLLRSGKAAGFVSNSADLIWLHPKEGESQRWEILHALALAKPGKTPIAELLVRNRSDIGQRTSLVLITPNTHADWIEALIPLMWRGIVPTVLLLDPASFDEMQNANGVLAVNGALAHLGVTRYTINRELLNHRPESRPGRQGQWEWRFSPTGRAIAVKQPFDFTWKRLS